MDTSLQPTSPLALLIEAEVPVILRTSLAFGITRHLGRVVLESGSRRRTSHSYRPPMHAPKRAISTQIGRIGGAPHKIAKKKETFDFDFFIVSRLYLSCAFKVIEFGKSYCITRIKQIALEADHSQSANNCTARFVLSTTPLGDYLF